MTLKKPLIRLITDKIKALLIKEAIEIEVRKRTPPTHFAGQIKELGDIINTLSAKDWNLTE
jgi:hypothetical protein